MNPLAKWNPIQQETKDAAQSGNASKLRDCLTRGADVLDRGLILSALESGDVATFQSILDFGVDINQEMDYSGTPLISALRYNHHALLEFLFAKGVGPNKGNWGHWLPPLSVAVRYTKDIKWVQRLLDAGAKIEGTGALHVAAFRGDLARMKFLLNHGADVNEITYFRVIAFLDYRTKEKPLHWAVAGGHLGAVRLLGRHDPDLTIQYEDVVTVIDRLDAFFAELAAAE
ncbi:hypothetical protein CNMCM5793_003309 [Aspergillus hiratsukae]|uniref:Ankyrin repeat domain-containing protein n=1 Tax=Aspergillus hiratsukae TaxID=1194566 RepID=A0A8H6PDM7_9EURO|nr:hypothetical protein CNMCM5793_003309 [Aspergillus hiratsukae]KAF7169824.1 hypothetical protein CNMCM6106_004727 [Aspergillus hiratsukae]